MMEFQLGETIVNYFMDLPETGEKDKDEKPKNDDKDKSAQCLWHYSHDALKSSIELITCVVAK